MQPPMTYAEVYAGDTQPFETGSGWIQWKGTKVCMDVHCICGYHGHVDTDFFYHYECPGCGEIFAVGQTVRLLPLTSEMQAWVRKNAVVHTDDWPE